MPSLYDPLALAGLSLANRIAMAPMTRSRAVSTIADEMTALYYRQRASAGLLITEGTPISAQAIGYLHLPGVYTDAQAEGWRLVTDAVHAEGGTIFAQLWHVGRISHVSLQPNGSAPISATDEPLIQPAGARGVVFIRMPDGTEGFTAPSAPRALATDEIANVIGDYAAAAARALRAGFDGVEIHGAHGYLVDVFLNSIANTRTDRYGGSIEGRGRFLLELIDAVGNVIGMGRLGVRLSPGLALQGVPQDPEMEPMFLYLAAEFERRGLGYVHFSDTTRQPGIGIPAQFRRKFRAIYKGPLILAGGMTKAVAEDLVATGEIDMAAFGQPFISNPDLVERLREAAPLTDPDRETYYGGGAAGYVDYPDRHAAR